MSNFSIQFIKVADGNDVFVHASALPTKEAWTDLAPGDAVTFDLVDSPNRPGSMMATNVRLVN